METSEGGKVTNYERTQGGRQGEGGQIRTKLTDERIAVATGQRKVKWNVLSPP